MDLNGSVCFLLSFMGLTAAFRLDCVYGGFRAGTWRYRAVRRAVTRLQMGFVRIRLVDVV